jgi:hypothetical protein
MHAQRAAGRARDGHARAGTLRPGQRAIMMATLLLALLLMEGVTAVFTGVPARPARDCTQAVLLPHYWLCLSELVPSLPTARPIKTDDDEQARTAIAVCRRMLQAAADKRVLVQWVKVKGHSHAEGNDVADTLAGYAQKGGAMNEQDIDQVMDGLRADDD